MWKLCDGRSHIKTVVAVLLLATISIFGIAVAPASDGDVMATDKVVTGTVTVEFDELNVLQYIQNQIGEDANFNPSSMDINSEEFKALFTVKGTVDGVSTELTDFYLYAGGPLQKGVNNISVYVLTMDGDFNEDLSSISVQDAVKLDLSNVDFEPVTVSNFTVTPPAAGSVYEGSTTAEEARNLISVVATYSDGTQHEIRDYSMSWISESANITVRYGFNDNNVSATFAQIAVPLKTTEVTSVVNNPETPIFSSDTYDSLRGKLTVTVMMNDNKHHVLHPDDFTVSGDDLYSGEDGTQVDKSISVTINNEDGTTVTSVPESFTIQPSTPNSIWAQYFPNAAVFYAYSEPDPSVIEQALVTFDHGPKYVTSHYSLVFKYTGTETVVPIDDLSTDHKYDLYIVYKENNKPVDSKISQTPITVQAHPVSYPHVDENTLTYNTQYQYWSVTGDEYGDILEPHFTCSVCGDQSDKPCTHIEMVVEHDDEGNIIGHSIKARDVGEYSVYFTFKDKYASSYTWDGNSGTTYYLEIDKAVADVSIDTDDITYGTMPNHTFSAVIDMGDNADPDQKPIIINDINWDKVTIQYSSNQTDIEAIYSPTDFVKGTWYVRVFLTEDSAPNYQQTYSDWFEFSVEPKKLSVSAEDGVFNESSLEPVINVVGIVDGDKDVFTTNGFERTNAGTYPVPVRLTNSNYVWERPDEGNPDVCTVDWKINPMKIPKPTLDKNVGTYAAKELEFEVSNYNSNRMSGSIVCSEYSESYSISNNKIILRDAGSYTVTFILDSSGNYVWTDGTENAVEYTISINKATVNLDVSVGSIYYGDAAPSQESYTTTFDWISSDADQSPGGEFKVFTGYDPDNGTRDSGTYKIQCSGFSNRNYKLGTVSGDLVVDKRTLTVSDITVDPIFYGDSAPSKDSYSVSLSGVVYGEEQSVLSALTFNTSYAVGSNADSYGITIVSDPAADVLKNYTLIIVKDESEFSGYLEVKRILVAISDNDTAWGFVADDTPPEVNVKEVWEKEDGGYEFGDEFTLFASEWTPDSGTTSFRPGEYTLKLTLTTGNYEWAANNIGTPSENGMVLTLDAEITHTPIQLTVNDRYSAKYGTEGQTDEAFKSWLATEGNLTVPDGLDAILKSSISDALNKTDSFSYEFYIGGQLYSSIENRDVFSMTITVVVSGDGLESHYVTAEVPISITKADIVLDPIDDIEDIEYNGDLQTIFVTLPTLESGQPISWTFSPSGDIAHDVVDGKDVFRAKDATTYTITYSASSTNYNIYFTGGDNQFKITIDPVDATLSFPGSVAGEENSYTYNGKYGSSVDGITIPGFESPSANGVGNDGVLGGITFTYDGQSKTWDEVIDLVSDVGNETSTLSIGYAFNHANYNNVEGELHFTIDPADLDVVMKSYQNGSEVSTDMTFNATDVRIQLSATGVEDLTGLSWELTVTHSVDGVQTMLCDNQALDSYTIRDAGTYTVQYEVKADHHALKTGSFTFTIAKADLTHGDTSEVVKYTYTGSANSIIIRNATGVGSPVVTYDFTVSKTVGQNTESKSFSSQRDWSEVMSYVKDAADYTISITANALNHNPDTYSLTVNITPKELGFTKERYELTYGEPVPSDDVLDGLVTGFVSGENFSDVFPDNHVTTTYTQGRGVNSEYIIDGTHLKNGNYVTTGLKISLTVSPMEISVTMPDINITYGEGLTLGGILDKVTYSPSLYGEDEILGGVIIRLGDTVIENPFSSLLNQGDYTIIPVSSDNPNYSISNISTSQSTLNVGKQAVSITSSEKGSVDYGIELDEEVLSGFFNIPEYVKNDVHFSFKGWDAHPTDVGRYTLVVTLDENSNYSLSNGIDGEVDRTIVIEHATYDVSIAFSGPDSSLVYSGGSNEFVISKDEYLYRQNEIVPAADGVAALTVSYSINGQPVSGVPSITDVGKYTIRATFVGDPNYKIEAIHRGDETWWQENGWQIQSDDSQTYLEIFVEIVPKQLYSTDIHWSEDDFEYDGSDQGWKVIAYYIDMGNQIHLKVEAPEFIHYNGGAAYKFKAVSFDEEDSRRGNYIFPTDTVSMNYHMKQRTVNIYAYDYVNDDGDASHNAITYGDKTVLGGYSDRLVSGDYESISSKHGYESTAAKTPDVGTASLTPYVVWVDGYDGEDYILIDHVGTVQVVARGLDITVDNQEWFEYNGNKPSGPLDPESESVGWSSTDTVAGDTISIALTLDVAKIPEGGPEGTYKDVIGIAGNTIGGEDGKNYVILSIDLGDFTILAREATLVITPVGGDGGILYDGQSVTKYYDSLSVIIPGGTVDTDDLVFTVEKICLNGKETGEIKGVGTYTVHYVATLPNHDLKDEDDGTVNGGTFTVRVNKAPNEWMSEDRETTGWKDTYQYGGFTFGFENYEEDDPAVPGEFTTMFTDTPIVTTVYGPDGDVIKDYTSSTTTPAGVYKVVVKVEETDNYSALVKEYSFTVAKRPLDVPSWKFDSIALSNGEATNVLIRYNISLMEATISGYVVEFDGSMTVDSTGTYDVIVRLLDTDNYQWKGFTDVDYVNVPWYVVDAEGVENFWRVIPDIQGWTYGDTPSIPVVGEGRYGGLATVRYYEYSSGTIGDEVQISATTNAGQYAMVASIPSDEGEVNGVEVKYDGISMTVPFSIDRKPVAIPDVVSVEYQGGATIDIPYSDTEAYSVLGEKQSEIGEYTATLVLNNNYCWTDRSVENHVIRWSIVSEKTLLNSYFHVDSSPMTYTGSAITKDVVCLKEGWEEGTQYSVTYENNTAVGTGYVVIEGVAENGYSGLVKIPFVIQKAKPVLDFVNNGFEKSDDSEAFTLNPYTSGLSDGDILWTSSDPSVAEVDPLTGEVTVKAIGQVTITATFVGDDNREQVSDSYDLNIEDGQTEVYVDRVVYIRVPVTDPDDPDDPTDDKPEEPDIVYKNDNTLYIILLLVLAVICVCFAAYIMYTHRKQEDQGGGQR